MRRVLASQEKFYLLFRMAVFDDIRAAGTGVLYYVYTEPELEAILAGP